MDGINDAVATELVSINYAKRRLGILPDEWYKLDEEFMEQMKWEYLPTETQVNEAMRILE